MYFGESIYKYILVLEKIKRKMRRVIKYKSLVIRFLTLDLILFLEKGLKITKVVYLRFLMIYGRFCFAWLYKENKWEN